MLTRRASAVDILRLLDYPNDFVPVLTRPGGDDAPTTSRLVGLVDKTALNARLARSYLVELLDRARIVSPAARAFSRSLRRQDAFLDRPLAESTNRWRRWWR